MITNQKLKKSLEEIKNITSFVAILYSAKGKHLTGTVEEPEHSDIFVKEFIVSDLRISTIQQSILINLLHARLIQMLQDMSYLVQRYYYTSQLQAQICQQELIQIHRLVTVITLSLHLIHTRFMYLIKKLN